MTGPTMFAEATWRDKIFLGTWTTTLNGSFEVTDKATGAVLSQLGMATPADVVAAAKASGNGSRIGGPANWEEFTQWQWVTIKDNPPPYPF